MFPHGTYEVHVTVVFLALSNQLHTLLKRHSMSMTSGYGILKGGVDEAK